MLVTLDYYRNTYLGEDASDALLTKWLTRASDDIIIVTGSQFSAISELETWQQDFVSKAVCAQAENYLLNDGEDLGDSFRIGNFSMSTGKSERNKGTLSDAAGRYLSGAGLSNRAIGSVQCDPYHESC
jgi:hypothetical protein